MYDRPPYRPLLSPHYNLNTNPMTYIDLLNEFWKQDKLNPTQALDAFFYFYLLGECNKRNWINPFELRSRIIEVKLMISRKTIGEVRNRLKQRGLIDFVSAKNCPTIYRICAIGNSDNNSVSDCFPQGTIKKQLREQSGNISGNNPATSKEISPTPPKEIYPTTNVVGENNINIISTTRVREEGNWECFDRLLQEVVDGKPYPQPFADIPTDGTEMISLAKGRNIGTTEFICGFKPETTCFYPLDRQKLTRTARTAPTPPTNMTSAIMMSFRRYY